MRKILMILLVTGCKNYFVPKPVVPLPTPRECVGTYTADSSGVCIPKAPYK